MGGTEPRVTLGLPVFNGEHYLAETLGSILSQTFPEFELIISDNASTDGTETICRDFAASDSRIRYQRMPANVGAARNFNRTVDLARAPLFKWSAHDDLLAPRYLEECVALVDSNPDAVWCQTRVGWIDADGALLGDEQGDPTSGMSYVEAVGQGEDEPTRSSDRPHRRFRAVLLETVGNGNWDVFGLMRTADLRATGCQRSFYGADKVTVAELALRGRYVEVPECLLFVRLHDSASAALHTAHDQQQWIDPAGRTRPVSARLKLLRAYLESIRGAPLDTEERIRCAGVVASYLFQVQKWRRVMLSEVSRQGTGRGYYNYLSRTSEQSR